jgi:hypothetical protein
LKVGVKHHNPNRQTSGESASLPQYLGCTTVFDMRLRVTGVLCKFTFSPLTFSWIAFSLLKLKIKFLSASEWNTVSFHKKKSQMKNPVLCYFTGHSNVYSYTFCRITIFIKNRNDSGMSWIQTRSFSGDILVNKNVVCCTLFCTLTKQHTYVLSKQ